ncbi:MAG TPA: PfkB family carbohydrate kinase [Thermomicrobiales bacterium]
MALDYLALGHVTLDRQADGGYLPGGTVLFSSVQAARLGLHAGIVTTGRPTALDGPLTPFRSEVAIELHPAAATTIFVNVGVGAARRQTLPEWAGPLDLTGTLPAARIVHLGPVARELDPARLPTFAPGVFVGATPQGWLRRWDTEGHVTETELFLPPALTARLDALVLSETEARRAEGVIAAVHAAGGLVVITRDAAGCTILDRTGERQIGTHDYPFVDDTGAGDIFAAAFFVALGEGQSPARAAAFANAAAGLSLAGRGPAAIVNRATIEDALRRSESELIRAKPEQMSDN